MPPERTLRTSNAGIYVLALGQTICWAGLYYLFAALLLSWEQSLGWSKTELTIALTCAVLISAMVAPLAGRIVDAGGGRWLLTIGALGGAVGLMLLSAVTTRTGFIATWAFIGVMQGACLYEACFAFMTRSMGDGARRGTIRLTLVAGFASPIAFSFGVFLADALGWRDAVLVFAVAVAALGAPLHYVGARLLEGGSSAPPPSIARPGKRSALRTAIRKPTFWLIAMAFPVMAMNHGILLNHIVPLLVERGFAKTTAVTAASLFGPMQVMGRLMVMGIENRIATLTLTLVSFGGIIAASILLLLADINASLVFAFAATQGAAYGLVSILRPAVIVETLGREGFGSIAGWLAVPYLAAFAFAPWIGALLWEAGGYELAIYAVIGMALIGVVSIAVLRMYVAREVRVADA